MALLKKPDRKPVLKPIVGLNFMDPSTLINDRGGFPQNMRLYRNDYKKREGKSALGGISLGGHEVNHIAQYPLSSLSIRLVRLTKKNVQKFNTSTMVWDDITGTDLTGAVTDFYDHVVAEDKLIFTNLVNNIRTYNDAGTTTDLVASTGSVPKCKFL